jgi:hypothetical protein
MNAERIGYLFNYLLLHSEIKKTSFKYNGKILGTQLCLYAPIMSAITDVRCAHDKEVQRFQ